MAQTPASASSAYADAAAMIKRYDVRVLGDLCGDTGGRATAADLADAGTTVGANLAEALKDASGEVEGAALRGARYDTATLAALTGMAAARLDRLVCRIAMLLLLERRDPAKPWPEWAKGIEEELGLLAAGERIFGTVETMAAGSGLDTVRPPDAQPGPRPALSETAGRFFGSRSRTYTTNGTRFPRGIW